jgi:hypothetical protein
MKLPPKDWVVSLEEIRKICEEYDLPQLWQKISKDPPAKPFKSDGCTMWLDYWAGVDLYPFCFFHDLKYWAGYPGEHLERLIADTEMMVDIARAGRRKMAQLMFWGVRVGGQEWLPTPSSWGFGRK